VRTRNPLVAPELREMLASGDSQALRHFCESVHPASAAELVSALSGEEAWGVLRHTDMSLRAEIFSHLDRDFQVEIIEILHRGAIARLLAEMSADDRADLFKHLPEELRESVLPAMAHVEREDIRRLVAYEEGTAGAVMTSDYATLSPELTASQAIEHLREVAPDAETIYYAYVIDGQRRLLGFVSLKDLILARRGARISDIMHGEAIFARVQDDQEDAARKIRKYDLIALPVVNDDDVLMGIITHDDAMDIITQEHTEDMEKFMAIAGSHEDAVYMRSSAWRHFKNRSIWVFVLALFGLVSGYIIQSFEGMLLQLVILTTFIPMLADTGGNTGSQSATLVVRALALKEVSPRDFRRVLAKEFQVAILLALMLGVVAFGRVLLFGAGSTVPEGVSLGMIAMAVSVALGVQVVVATLVGALMPLLVSKLNRDPAVIASPALTTIVDITGLLIFFATVKLMLGI